MLERNQIHALAVLPQQRYSRKPLNSKVGLTDVDVGTKIKMSGLSGSKTTTIKPTVCFTNWNTRKLYIQGVSKNVYTF
jgi:hypothetical protein